MARTTETQELLGTIARVACGETVLSPAQIDRLVEVVRDPSRPRRAVASVPSLTAREWQILERMRDGRTMPEIAGELYLSPVTVRSHARSIRRKLAADEQLRDPIYR
jgi:DNA-binding NarL/FixJ family response regulator